MSALLEYPQRHPMSAKEYLRMGEAGVFAPEARHVVEVSDAILELDSETKVPLYARAGIAEVWVVDLERCTMHVFREPDPGGYRASFTPSGDEILSAGPELAVEIGALFPA